jgi:hypothetical protein
VSHIYTTGSTSGGSFSMGCTSGAPSLRDGIHLWWLVHHALYLWCPIHFRWLGLHGCTSDPPLYVMADHALQVSTVNSPSCISRIYWLANQRLARWLVGCPSHIPRDHWLALSLVGHALIHSIWCLFFTGSTSRGPIYGFHVLWTCLRGFHILWTYLHRFCILRTW